jgi:hypothetical protein
MKKEILLKEKQLEKLEHYLEDFTFRLGEYEIQYVPDPKIIIHTDNVYKIIRDFLYSKFRIKI